ncbi:MAG: Trk system potassium transporter TrkA [Paludibacteraceae bacterium]|nr:Trk system potassium transporter TrkA [Paludibacteraceae bacterium]
MKIIIVGAGEVGRHVAKMLSYENHEIIIMDKDENNLSDLDSNYDIMSKIGDPTSPSDLLMAGVKGCNLFIAVTPYESENINSCILAHNLGAIKTVARINNYEYLLPKNKELFNNIGVNVLIYPEMLVANEIVQSVQRSWIREFRSFCDDAMVLVCIRVRSNAEILNKPFKTGFFDHDRFRIVAIKRESHTIIPGGNDEIMANDLVYFIATRDNLEYVRTAAGKTDFQIHNIIIMGGSKIAVKVTQYLPAKIHVKIIEADRAHCYKLADEVDALIINGDGRNLDLLKDEGIEESDAFVAVTNNSEANVLACLAAKRLGIRKTIAQIENVDYIELADKLDIGTIINKKLTAASYIYQQTLDEDTQDVQCLTYSDAQVVEFKVKAGDKITKSRIRDMKLPEDVNIGGIVRKGQGMVVNGNTVILPDDHVIVFCKASSAPKISKFFQ